MNQSFENDLHVITYVDDYKNMDNMKKLKNFRKFHTKNTDRYFHIKFYTVTDKKLAEKLKISTNEENIGDVYMIRLNGIFNPDKKNTELCGYPFHSEKILSSEDINKDSKILLWINHYYSNVELRKDPVICI